ncbi:hypothetical protein B0T24DRAFT_598332 [Lasiosphaeria ovina]|uniref:Uncharacterized protein n=1 Tax=Lasiosphaeria ovina TaxID=92902 RepID=A0AAE0JVB0_9PEZI|nr:hypothetical protein B0T24DRAFT_598332 [Lasiosphaeria ovina]
MAISPKKEILVKQVTYNNNPENNNPENNNPENNNPESTSIIVRLLTDFSSAVLTETLKYIASRYYEKSAYLGYAKNGLVVSEWVAEVAKAVGGGSAGGKGTGTTSVGSGTDMAKVEEGVDAARVYLERLKNFQTSRSELTLRYLWKKTAE